MQRTHLLVAASAAAFLALGACNNGPETVNGAYDPQAEALKNAAPVQLPPAMTESRTYRCSDNSLYYVDFYNNNTATIRTSQDGIPTMLNATDGAPPFAAEGYSVSGNGTHVSINGKSCHT